MRIKDGTDIERLLARVRKWEDQLSRAGNSDLNVSKDLWRTSPKIGDRSEAMTSLSRWYMDAIERIESHLRKVLDDSDVAGLFNDRFWKMMDQGDYVASTLHFHLVCRYQAEWLGQVRSQLEALAVFAEGTGTMVVPDTNVFAHCGTVREINWRSLAGAAAVRVVVPHVVVEELDDLKRTGRDRDVRVRVRHALAALKQVLGSTPPGSAADAGDGVTVAILPDPLGHQRLPANDDEICDRTVLLRQFTGPVVLATNDMGMHVRARAFGLDVLEVPEQETS